MPTAMKPHISAFVWFSLVNAAVASAMMAILQAPLNKAVPVVTTIIPRQVRQINLNKFMRLSFLGCRGCCRHRLNEAFFDLFGQMFYVRFDKDIFVRTGNVFYIHATARKSSPTKILREGAEDRLPARAQERNVTGVRPLHVGHER